MNAMHEAIQEAEAEVRHLKEKGKKLRQKLDAVKKENRKLNRLLGFDRPFSVFECLRVLAKANEHLRTVHSCDTHGYETFFRAEQQALEYVKQYEKGGE